MRKRTIPFLLALAATGLLLGNATEADASGSIFQVTPSPDPLTAPISNDLLNGTAVISPQDSWAVGYATDPTVTDHPLAEHWNGTRWSVTPTPEGTSGSRLAAVAAVSSKDVWAVGLQNSDLSIMANTTLIEHWNGSVWSVMPSPDMDPQGANNSNTLSGVAATAPGVVTAVGAWDSLQQGNPGLRTLTLTTTRG